MKHNSVLSDTCTTLSHIPTWTKVIALNCSGKPSLVWQLYETPIENNPNAEFFCFFFLVSILAWNNTVISGTNSLNWNEFGYKHTCQYSLFIAQIPHKHSVWHACTIWLILKTLLLYFLRRRGSVSDCHGKNINRGWGIIFSDGKTTIFSILLK